MKTLKRVFTFFFAALAITALAGCGVSKEDHEKTVSELSKTKEELAQTKAKMAEMEKSLNAAQAQLKSQAKKPSPAEAPTVEKKPETADKGMQEKLAATQKETDDLRAKVASLTGENNSLKSMLDKIKGEYAELQKKLGGGVQVPTQQLPAGLPKRP